VSPRAAAVAAALALGCVSPRPAGRPPPIPLAPAGPQHDELDVAGVVHVVRKGETLYRIARTYGIDPADLMETNGISDPRALEVGTELFVPGADRVLDVPAAPGAAAGPAPTAPSVPGPPERGAREASAEPRETPDPSPAASATAPAPSRATRLAWPLRGVLYGRYGVRQGHRHDGIDIAAPEGTIVGAAAAGQVIYVGEQAGYGNIVILRHGDALVTLYAHASRILVEEGQTVARGDPVARVGQTGRTTGPHLHFEVRDGTRARNPLLYLP
jgi:lipoprotein NlpD